MGTVSGKGSAVKRKRYPRKFKLMAVERMRGSENVGELARELGVTRRCLYKWRTKLGYLLPEEKTPGPNWSELAYRHQVRELKRLLAEKALEVDFLKGALQKVEARRQKSSASGDVASTTKSES
jgi:transposase-like protein